MRVVLFDSMERVLGDVGNRKSIGERRVLYSNGSEIVRIPAGEFMMGSLDGDRYA